MNINKFILKNLKSYKKIIFMIKIAKNLVNIKQ